MQWIAPAEKDKANDTFAYSGELDHRLWPQFQLMAGSRRSPRGGSRPKCDTQIDAKQLMPDHCLGALCIYRSMR